MQIYEDKKRLRRVSQQSAILDTHTSKRLFITDKNTNTEYLIDCGADKSVLKPTQLMRDTYNKNPNDGDVCTRFEAANGTPIRTYGTKLMEVNLNLRRKFQWRFTVADVKTSIIGADFLYEFGLLVDVRGKQVIDKKTGLTSKGVVRKISEAIAQVSLFNKNDKFAFLFEEFKDLLDDKPSFRVKEKANVTHFIETFGQPVTSKARRLNQDKLTAAKAEFDELLRLGICRPSNSNYASPLHMVKKGNGGWRPCGDYRRLNAKTIPDQYPTPFLRDFQNNLHKKKFFSRIDLRKAYHQIPMNEEDIPKTAIITPFGLFEFLFMTFGLRNASKTFQRLMDEVFRGLDFVFCYIDDIFIASTTYDEHIGHIRIVMQRLRNYGLRINLDKCEFAKNEIKFLGHLVTPDGIQPLPEKVEAMKRFPKPTMACELRKFIMMINFYNEFLPKAAHVRARLQSLIIGNKKNDRSIISWTNDAEAAFEEYKQMLAEATMLVHPAKNPKLIVATDACGYAIGGEVRQVIDGELQPLGFFSQKLSDTETRYPTYDRELLAIYRTIQHFEHLLEGRDFEVYCDHAPLSYAFTKKSNKRELPRRIEQLQYISEFTTKIIYLPGKENIVADLLSRIEQIDSKSIDYRKIATAQENDDELKEFLASDKTSLQLKSVNIPDTDITLMCDTSGKNIRPFIPNQFRSLVLEQIHGLSHPGVRATTKLVQERFVWPNLQRSCKEFVKHCIACQKCKIQRHTKAPVTQYGTKCDRFEHVNVDIVGPLPESHGYSYLLTIIDRATRWIEAIPTSNITAETIAKAIISGWIARFGIPQRISTDRGRQFECQVFNQLNQMLGIQHLRTTSFHAQANGMIERWHRSLKVSLKAKFTNNWIDELPLVLLGLRIVIKDDINASPAEMTYGKSLTMPGQFFEGVSESPIDTEFVRKFKQTMSRFKPADPKYHGQPKFFVHPELNNAKHVFIRIDAHRTPLQAPYKGPYEVIKSGTKVFKVNINGKPDTVSIDRLKPAFVLNQNENDEPVIQPRRQITPGNQNQRPHTTTRSGRKVHFPERLRL